MTVDRLLKRQIEITKPLTVKDTEKFYFARSKQSIVSQKYCVSTAVSTPPNTLSMWYLLLSRYIAE